MAITPRIRDFLVDFDAVLERVPAPGLDRDGMTITTADQVALVRLPHRDGTSPPLQLEVDDRKVVVDYGGEPLHLHGREFTLQFVEALLEGRIEIEIRHGPLWRTTRSYLDDRARPFLTTRMPVPSLHPRTERRRVGFG